MATNQPSTFNETEGSLRRRGFEDASRHLGSIESLGPCLRDVEKSLLDDLKSRSAKYEAAIAELQAEITKENARATSLDTEKTTLSTKIEKLKTDLDALRHNLKKDDTGLLGESNPFVMYPVFFLVVLLTGYLFLFYSSTLFSAIYRNLGEDLAALNEIDGVKNLFRSVFDPRAINQAASDGAAGLAFILLGPVVPMAIGYLVVVRKGLQRILVVLLVLFFDCLLAYKITKELYEAKVLTGLAEQQWQANMVLYDVNFFLIIVAGFVGYICWGLLIEKLVLEYESMRPNRAERRQIRAEQGLLTRRVKEIDNEHQHVQKNIRMKMAEKEGLSDPSSNRVLSTNDFEAALNSFFAGWLNWTNQRPGVVGDNEAVQAAKTALKKYKDDLPKRFKSKGQT